MRLVRLIVIMAAFVTPVWSQTAQLKTAAEVLDRYKQVLGGADAIRRIQSRTVRGEIEGTGISGKMRFVYYAKPFKSLFKVTRPDGAEILQGFDGNTSWSLTPQGASIDKDTPLESARRDADLQYALHQPDYFTKLELAGITDFEGRPCYWLHGTTHWGKDNNQFYDVRTGLLAGYRFQADDSSKAIITAVFEDYKDFGGTPVATKNTSRSGDHFQTFVYQTVTYEPLPDSLFELPGAVKALIKQ